MADWLEDARERLESGVEGAGDLVLSSRDAELLLQLARIAAHESGERTNAPLVCFLVGLAVGRGTATVESATELALGRDTDR
ncbi:MAG TPA: DUF6457 domain-containing protein [Gaiella sp.]|nr:DUF6457 domain-containing protein [Gaiella sp.]